MRDYSHIDEHVWELINGQIDGELSKGQQQELDVLLAESDELREMHNELSSFGSFLDKTPAKIPPGYLKNAITSTVRLPLEKQQLNRRRSFATWLTEHWLGPVFALTAGVIMTVGIYETNPETVSPVDTATMSGSIVNSKPTQEGQLLDRLQIRNNLISGSAEVRGQGQDVLVDIVLDSAQPNEFKLDYAANDLAFVGLASLQNQIDAMSVDAGEVAVESTGKQHYTIRFRGPQDAGTVNTHLLKVNILVDSNMVQQAELKTRN